MPRALEHPESWRGSGLGTVGADATLRALSLAQVEELLIAASPDALSHAAAKPDQECVEAEHLRPALLAVEARDQRRTTA